jgi:hypothetical protein
MDEDCLTVKVDNLDSLKVMSTKGKRKQTLIISLILIQLKTILEENQMMWKLETNLKLKWNAKSRVRDISISVL